MPKPANAAEAMAQIKSRDAARYMTRGGIAGVNLLLGYAAAEPYLEKGEYGQAAIEAGPSLVIAGSQAGLFVRDRIKHGSWLGLSGNPEKATERAAAMVSGTKSVGSTNAGWTRVAGVLSDIVGKGLFFVDMMMNLESDNPALTRAMKEREEQQKATGGVQQDVGPKPQETMESNSRPASPESEK